MKSMAEMMLSRFFRVVWPFFYPCNANDVLSSAFPSFFRNANGLGNLFRYFPPFLKFFTLR